MTSHTWRGTEVNKLLAMTESSLCELCLLRDVTIYRKITLLFSIGWFHRDPCRPWPLLPSVPKSDTNQCSGTKQHILFLAVSSGSGVRKPGPDFGSRLPARFLCTLVWGNYCWRDCRHRYLSVRCDVTQQWGREREWKFEYTVQVLRNVPIFAHRTLCEYRMPALNDYFQSPYRSVDFFARSNWHRTLDGKKR